MYKCGAFNPVTGETVVQPHGTKLSVKRESDDIQFKIQNCFISLLYFLFWSTNIFICLFRFRLLPPSADSLPHHPKDCFGAAVTVADAGVYRVR